MFKSRRSRETAPEPDERRDLPESMKRAPGFDAEPDRGPVQYVKFVEAP
jgi:hypothetical protein